MKTVQLPSNILMPIMGVGTWEIRDAQIIHAVLDAALASGYRAIDTAAAYGNESMIGESLQTLLPKYGLTRKDIFITSKLKTSDHGTGNAYQACLNSLTNLRTDYLDLYLIHFPGASGYDNADPKQAQLRRGSWGDFEKLKGEGHCRAIGVSNYMVPHLDEMRTYAAIWPPAVNQCEYHPHLRSPELVEYCRKEGIHFQAYSSLGGSKAIRKLTEESLVREMAQTYHCSEVQLLLAWALNQGIGVIPKTTNPEHVKSNLRALEIEISEVDINKLGSLDTSARYCWDPSGVA